MNKISLMVYDIEVFPNFHSFSGIDVDTKERFRYILYDDMRNVHEYFAFLNSLKGRYKLIGFNNLAYDYPVLHYIMLNEDYILSKTSIAEVTAAIYRLSQNIINKPYSIIDAKSTMIEQIDLFKVYHLNNKARRASLKDIEVAMNFHNVQDLPKKYYELVYPDEVKEIMDYNDNDVDATLEFYLRSTDRIKLREDLSKEYEIDLTNADDPKIGSEIFAKIITKELRIDRYSLDKMRTYHKDIALADIIFPHIKFKTSKFKEILAIFNSVTLNINDFDEEKNEKKTKNIHSTTIDNLSLVYGVGGIHSDNKPEIRLATDKVKMIDADITSMYPNIAIRYGLYPKHLGPKFCQIYEDVFNKRAAAKKAGNTAVNEGLKLALNGKV